MDSEELQSEHLHSTCTRRCTALRRHRHFFFCIEVPFSLREQHMVRVPRGPWKFGENQQPARELPEARVAREAGAASAEAGGAQ